MSSVAIDRSSGTQEAAPLSLPIVNNSADLLELMLSRVEVVLRSLLLDTRTDNA